MEGTLRTYHLPVLLFRYRLKLCPGIDDHHLLTKAEHGQVHRAVREAAAVLLDPFLPDLSFLKKAGHLDLPLVVSSGKIRKQGHQVPELDPRAITGIKPQSLPQGPGVELGAGRDQNKPTPLLSFRREHFQHGRIKLPGHVVINELLHQFLQPLPGHPPEKGKEDSLQPFGPKHPGKNEERQEEKEIRPAQGLSPQDPVAEKQLGIPGDEGLIEIKEGYSLAVLVHHEDYVGTAVILGNDLSTVSTACPSGNCNLYANPGKLPHRYPKPVLPDRAPSPLLGLVTPVLRSLVAAALIPFGGGLLNAECEPANFRVAIPFLSRTSLEISWADNCDDETGYEFQVLSGQDWVTITTSPPNSTLLSLRGGSPNSTVTFRMRTLRPDGNSEWTEPVEATLPTEFAIEAGRFIGGTVGESLTGPALRVYNSQGEGTASGFEVTDLPPGWEFDASNGVISGTPSAPGVYRPVISATDGTSTASTFVTFRIKPAITGPEETSPVPDFLFLTPPTGRIRYNLSPHFRDPDTSAAIRFRTNLGDIDSILYLETCPAHVENLLNYIDRGDYDGVIFHRSAIPATSGVAVVQAGLMKPDGNGDYSRVVTDPPVVDEPALSNLMGTLAMAKTSDPNSGSSQVYFNTTDNTNLDGAQPNGGYTVFGRATSGSLPVLADIYSRPRGNYTVSVDTFDLTINDWPTTSEPEGDAPADGDLVQILEAMRIEEILSYRIASADNAALVNASLEGAELTLDPVPGATGTASVVVEVSDLDGSTLPVELSYCVLNLGFEPGLSANGHPIVTFRHEKEPASLSYEVQSSRDGLAWTTFWRTADGTTAGPVITRTDLGSAWQLSIEDSSISSPATSTALLRIVVSK